MSGTLATESAHAIQAVAPVRDFPIDTCKDLDIEIEEKIEKTFLVSTLHSNTELSHWWFEHIPHAMLLHDLN